MHRYRGSLVSFVIVIAAIALAVGAGATPVGPGQSDGATGGDGNAIEGSPGAHLAGIVAVQDRSVRGTVDRESFGARLDDAAPGRERAAVVDRELNATARQVTALERRHRTAVAARENGTLDAGGYAVRVTAVDEEAAAVDRRLDDVETAASELPAAVREERQLAERVDLLHERVGTLRERTREQANAVRAPDGPTRVNPIDHETVETAATMAVERDRRIGDALGAERIDLHVRTANGSTLRAGVRTESGQVVDVERGPIEDPTLRVYTDHRVVRALSDTDDPGAVDDALADGRIVYEGVGIVNSLKYGVVAIVEWVTGLA